MWCFSLSHLKKMILYLQDDPLLLTGISYLPHQPLRRLRRAMRRARRTMRCIRGAMRRATQGHAACSKRTIRYSTLLLPQIHHIPITMYHCLPLRGLHLIALLNDASTINLLLHSILSAHTPSQHTALTQTVLTI